MLLALLHVTIFVSYAFINAQYLHVIHVAMTFALTNKPQLHMTQFRCICI